MRPELVLNEEQKNRRFRSSFSLRCENVSTHQRQQQASSSGTEGEGADQYEDVAVQAIEEAPELKTEPFVRVSVIQQNRQTPPYVPAVAEPLCLSDRSVLVQEEIDIMWHYIHKKFRRKKETELILRFECKNNFNIEVFYYLDYLDARHQLLSVGLMKMKTKLILI